MGSAQTLGIEIIGVDVPGGALAFKDRLDREWPSASEYARFFTEQTADEAPA